MGRVGSGSASVDAWMSQHGHAVWRMEWRANAMPCEEAREGVGIRKVRQLVSAIYNKHTRGERQIVTGH